jgi:hypothetical protein
LEALEDRCLLSGGISLTPNEAAPQLVGEPVTWTATVPEAPPSLVYQFSVGSPGGPFQMVRDFSPDDSFTYAPMQQGEYRIQVTVKDGFDATDTQSAVVTDKVDSRVTGDQPVVSPTANPLVALFSAPPGPVGTVHVEFAVAGDNPSWQSTNDLPSLPSRSTNFLVAGMLPSTTYEMRDVFSDGTASAPLLFTTGAIPSTVSLPTFTVPQPPGPGSDLDQDLLFQQLANPPKGYPNPFVTDLAGHVVWYYDLAQAGLHGEPAMGADLVPGGTVLLTGADSRATLPYSQDILREIDLAGDTVRETNLDAINAQLAAMGHEVVYSLTHDVTRLPDGKTAVIGVTERTVSINGTPTEYVGDDIIVLDENFQVAWVWDSFDHLDVNRGPILGETVQPGVLDPDAAVPDLPAVDWLHANSVDWSPADGNLTLSLRNQDWVIKIDYENGAGDGHVVWRLGQGGDFTVNSTDPSPWFSGQHDAHYIDDSTIILFDDGDTRRESDPTADSRGQVWKIDEQTMTATLVFNADLGNYSDALGSAQRLSNGDYSFDSGRQGQAPIQIAQTIEVRPDGSKAYVLQLNKNEYRSFRIRTLYQGISDQLTVTSAADSGPGSLRSEIALAQSGDTIDFDPSLAGQTITLTSGELAITKSLDIEGLGANLLTVSGGDASRVFDVSAGVTVTIAGMTMTDGLANGSAPVVASAGGGILNLGSLTLSNDVLSDNQAVGALGGDGLGGGIDNEPRATLTVISSAFAHNRAVGGDGDATHQAGNGLGGALENLGAKATVSHSWFTDNEATGGDNTAGGLAGRGEGGGMFNETHATLIVTESTLTSNLARGGRRSKNAFDNGFAEGGGLGNRGTLAVSSSTFEHNQAVGGAGSLSGISGGNGLGGGLMSNGSASAPASASIDHSTFSDNQAAGGTGGAAATGGAGAGGGIFTDTGTFLLDTSSLLQNEALGGAGGSGGRGRGGAFAAGSQNGNTVVAVSNCMLTANQAVGGAASNGGAAGIGSGGGISNQVNIPGHTADLTIDRCMLLGNQALGGTGDTGGTGRGGGIENVAGATLTVSDSTLLGNQAVGDDALDGGNGGNGLGGGVFNDGASSVTFQASQIVNNTSIGGTAGSGGAAGQGIGGGLYLTPGGSACADALTVIVGNHASTSDDDVFGTLGQC